METAHRSGRSLSGEDRDSGVFRVTLETGRWQAPRGVCRHKGTKAGHQGTGGTRSLRDFQSEGCPGPTKRIEDSQGMAGEEFSRSLSVSDLTDHE